VNGDVPMMLKEGDDEREVTEGMLMNPSPGSEDDMFLGGGGENAVDPGSEDENALVDPGNEDGGEDGHKDIIDASFSLP